MDHEASTARGEETPRWVRVALVWSLAATFGMGTFAADFMQATGLQGTWWMVASVLPLYVVAAHGWRRVETNEVFSLAALLCAALVGSSFLGEHTSHGLLRSVAVPGVFAWAVAFAAWPRMQLPLARWGVLFWCITLALNTADRTRFNTNNILAYLVMGLYASARARGDVTEREAAWWSAALPLMVFLVVRSTFRAASLAAMGLLLAMSIWRREARFGLVLAALGAALYTSQAGEAEPTYSRMVDRSDYVGRFRTMHEDNLSGRMDIWEGVLSDVQDLPDWLWIGHGFGDVDIYVARVNPYIPALVVDGVRYLHSHNQLLDILVATGVPGVLLLVVLVVAVARRVQLRDASAAYAAGLALVGSANGMVAEGSGSTAAIGLLLVMCGTRRATPPTPRTLPWVAGVRDLGAQA